MIKTMNHCTIQFTVKACLRLCIYVPTFGVNKPNTVKRLEISLMSIAQHLFVSLVTMETLCQGRKKML